MEQLSLAPFLPRVVCFFHSADYVRLFLSAFLCLLENCVDCFVIFFFLSCYLLSVILPTLGVNLEHFHLYVLACLSMIYLIFFLKTVNKRVFFWKQYL